MKLRRTGVALAAVGLLSSGLWPQHTHELSERDLAAHDRVGQAELVHSVERCGRSPHLHALQRDGHQACPACLAGAATVGVPCPSALGSPTSDPLDVTRPGAPRLVATMALRHADGRAPPVLFSRG